MRLSHVGHLGVKELRSLLRDPMMLVLILYSFTIAIYSAATVMPETLQQAPIAIVDEDHSPLAGRIIDGFRPPYFQPPELISQLEMDSRMDAGRDTFALDIPPNFQRDLLAQRQPTLQLNVDATRMTQAFAGAGYIQSIVLTEVNKFAASHQLTPLASPVALDLRARFNPELNRIWFGSVMEVINQVTLLSIILAGAALLREREHGTVEHLLVSPLRVSELFTAKVIPVVTLVPLAAVASVFGMVHGVFQTPIRGSVALFYAVTVVYVFAMASLGLAIAVLARNLGQAMMMLLLILYPMTLLSGAFSPPESMGLVMRWVSLLSPVRHYVDFGYQVLFKGNSLAYVWQDVVGILALGVALFVLSARRFARLVR